MNDLQIHHYTDYMLSIKQEKKHGWWQAGEQYRYIDICKRLVEIQFTKFKWHDTKIQVNDDVSP